MWELLVVYTWALVPLVLIALDVWQSVRPRGHDEGRPKMSKHEQQLGPREKRILH
jgi:hypothetical protein